MFARFIRFYTAYTLRDVMQMRARQFFAMNKQIGTITKEEEAHALSIHHNSKPGDRVKELVSELNAKRKIVVMAESSIALVSRGEAKSVAAAEIEAVRERQKQAAAEIAEDREAWLEKLKERLAAEATGQQQN